MAGDARWPEICVYSREQRVQTVHAQLTPSLSAHLGSQALEMLLLFLGWVLRPQSRFLTDDP